MAYSDKVPEQCLINFTVKKDVIFDLSEGMGNCVEAGIVHKPKILILYAFHSINQLLTPRRFASKYIGRMEFAVGKKAGFMPN